MAAQWEVRHDAAELRGKLGRHVAPKIPIHGRPVGEHDWRAATALAVFDRPRRQVHRPALAQRLADRHRNRHHAPIVNRLAIPFLGLLLLLSACSGSGAGTEAAATTQPTAPGSGPRIGAFVIVLENHSFDQVIGSPQAPFINGLARRGALFTRYFGLAHPSLPNYLAILGGSTFGIRSDCTGCKAKDPNLAGQLSDAGVSWRAYMEGMPEPCFTEAQHGAYAKRHNPFLYFPSILGQPELCDRVVPATRLPADERSDTLPAFGWLTPNLCHDAHDCPLRAADRYLAGVVPDLLRHLGPHGFLVLTFDEG